MKLRHLLAAGFLATTLPDSAQTTVLSETFDTDAAFTKYSGTSSDLTDLDTVDGDSNPITFLSDGSDDYFGIFDPDTAVLNSNDFDGGTPPTLPSSDQLDLIGNTTPFLTFQDLDGDPPNEPIRAVQWDNLDITGLPGLQFSVDLAEGDNGTSHNIDDADFFVLQVRLDSNDDMDWITVLAFYGNNPGSIINGDWGRDADFDGAVDDPLGSGAEITNTWTPFTGTIQSTGNDIDVRLVVRVDGTDEDLSIDNLVISEATDTPPGISTLVPLDNADNVPLDQVLAITFDEPVQPGSGNIRLMQDDPFGGSPVESFSVSGPAVAFSGNTVSINPSANLNAFSSYFIEIDNGAIQDLAGNPFPGIAGQTQWNFTATFTDSSAPSIFALSPADEASGADPAANLVITFNEPVDATIFGGSIRIIRSSDSFPVDTLSVTSTSVIFTPGSQDVGIDPSITLDSLTDYHVQIDASAIEDASGNLFDGILDDSTWNFTTAEILPELVITEIMYNPATSEAGPSPEWIEIYNAGSLDADLTGCQLDDEDPSPWGSIASGTLEPGNYAVIFNSAFTDETTFRNEWSVPAGALVLGVSWGGLANEPSITDEILALKSPHGTVIDEVNFDDSGDWPSDSPEGPSIALVSTAYDQLSNDSGLNWVRSDELAEQFNAVNATGPAFSTTDRGSPGFDGTGGVPTNTFAGWLTDNGYTSTGFDNDDDGDGDSSGIEWYFFNTSPNAPSGNGSPLSGLTSTGAGTFTFTHLRPVDASEVIVTYEYSLDLGATWNPGDATVTITPGAPTPDVEGYEAVTVTVSVDPPTTPKVFVRVSITEETPM